MDGKFKDSVGAKTVGFSHAEPLRGRTEISILLVSELSAPIDKSRKAVTAVQNRHQLHSAEISTSTINRYTRPAFPPLTTCGCSTGHHPRPCRTARAA